MSVEKLQQPTSQESAEVGEGQETQLEFEKPEKTKERQADFDQKAIMLAQEAKRSFSSNNIAQALDKLRELLRAVDKKLAKEREQYGRLERMFDNQVKNLLEKGFHKDFYKKLENLDEQQQQFVAALEPLKNRLKALSSEEFKEGRIPFVIVPIRALYSLEEGIKYVEINGVKGHVEGALYEIKTRDDVKTPKYSFAYLIVDVDAWKDTLTETVDEAVKQFKEEGRSPLTAEEGIAVVLQYPEILQDVGVLRLPGSIYKGSSPILKLEKRYGSSPHIDPHGYSGKCRSASCGSRIEGVKQD